MLRRYVTVDVFTTHRFGGNPLAVVLDAEGLDAAAMQSIAREFNYAETTFVLPPRDPANTAQVRIFTPGRELPFAGHPNVGTAFVLGRMGRIAGQARFEEAAGLVVLDLLRDGAVVGAEFLAPQPLSVAAAPDADAIARAISLAAADFAGPPCIASVGLPFVLAELVDRAALARAAPDTAAFRRLFGTGHPDAVLLYTQSTGADCDYHARMFSPLDGIGEDPATGSANAALAGLLADRSTDANTTLSVCVAQGEDMGRPSLLMLRAVRSGGRVTSVHVAGRCVPVMEGVLLD